MPRKTPRDKNPTPPDLEEALGYTFHDPAWLHEALTHTSYAYEKKTDPTPAYERLEFLGDAVLELLISHTLWLRFPELHEGELTALRASLVRRETLAEIAREIQLGEALRLGKGERKRGGRERTSILADAIEALLAAVFVDGGFEAARTACMRLFQKKLDALSDPYTATSEKNQLQELAATLNLPPPRYLFLHVSGSSHAPTFTMQAQINTLYTAIGQGSSKKEATQQAAEKLLQILREQPPPPPHKQDNNPT